MYVSHRNDLARSDDLETICQDRNLVAVVELFELFVGTQTDEHTANASKKQNYSTVCSFTKHPTAQYLTALISAHSLPLIKRTAGAMNKCIHPYE
jgi:hypothetical protein